MSDFVLILSLLYCWLSGGSALVLGLPQYRFCSNKVAPSAPRLNYSPGFLPALLQLHLPAKSPTPYYSSVLLLQLPAKFKFKFATSVPTSTAPAPSYSSKSILHFPLQLPTTASAPYYGSSPLLQWRATTGTNIWIDKSPVFTRREPIMAQLATNKEYLRKRLICLHYPIRKGF